MREAQAIDRRVVGRSPGFLRVLRTCERVRPALNPRRTGFPVECNRGSNRDRRRPNARDGRWPLRVSLWPERLASLEVVETIPQRGWIVVGELTRGELAGGGRDLVAQAVALAEKPHGFDQEFVLVGVAAAGGYLW